MNYLAHAVLSPQDAAILTGNLIADSIKGNLESKDLDASIKKGIALHRFIDTYTDSNRYVDLVNRILHPHFHHYASVLSDIYFDYCLYKNWALMMPYDDFHTYKNQIYTSLRTQQHHIPEQQHWMIQHDWLESYTTLAGIQYVCDRLAHRVQGKIDLSHSADILEQHLGQIEPYFLLFFPLLQEACRRELRKQP